MSNTPTPSLSNQRTSLPTRPASPGHVSIVLDGSERCIYVGKTGTGKSFLAKHNLKIMAARRWRVVIVDISGFWCGKNPKWEKRGGGTVERPRLVTHFDPKLAVQLYIPTQPAAEDAGLVKLCADVLKTGNTCIYFDELYGIVTATRAPAAFLQLWAQGRKHNIAAWAATQRPRKIPEEVMSQAEHYFVFRIPGKDDRKRIAEYTATPRIERELIPSRFWWYYHAETMDEAMLMQPIRTPGKAA